MGEANEERELKVDIDGEYCHITVDDHHIQFKNQLSEESIVVDVFNGDEVYKELGYVTYDDLRMQEPEEFEMKKHILTEQKVKAYFDGSASECPYCGSSRIKVESPDCEFEHIWREGSCENDECLGAWTEEYELIRIFSPDNKEDFTKRQVNPTKDYEAWWFDVGSGIAIKDGEDMEDFARRVTQIAWEDRMVLEEVKKRP